MVLGLPRGGVPVAYEVATALEAPLDVVLVRKLGAPFQPEYAIGAVGEGDVLLVDAAALGALGVEERQLLRIVDRERAELDRRNRRYRHDRDPVDVVGRTVILVDDGMATGSTAAAAAQVLRRRGAGRVVVAAPVGPPGIEARLRSEADAVVCLESPESFFSVGGCYEHFDQTTDDEVERLLALAAGADPPAPPAPQRRAGGADWSRVARHEVLIPAGEARLAGELRLPPAPAGAVIFAHGSGSSRLSPRNLQVATTLNGARLGTLLFDLLTEEEAADRRNVFDVGLLGDRLAAATRWAQERFALSGLPLGYLGASTGAAAALCAAAALDGDIRAVVCRGGRPDLAGDSLREVTAPTLLIVGGDDWNVLALNDEAAASLRCPHELAVVPHATHLFEEPGALEEVSALATRWFAEHLPT